MKAFRKEERQYGVREGAPVWVMGKSTSFGQLDSNTHSGVPAWDYTEGMVLNSKPCSRKYSRTLGNAYSIFSAAFIESWKTMMEPGFVFLITWFRHFSLVISG